MKKTLPWALLLCLSLVIVGAYLWAPLAKGFKGESSRILFFHVPMAISSFVAFLTAGVASALYLARGRQVRHDWLAQSAVELGLLFATLATITGAMWARTMWGAFWNWDPRQTSIVFAMIFYAAYIVLRGSILDPETRRRLSAAYAALGLVVAPFLFFVAPRLVDSLHPQPLINAQGKVHMEGRMLTVFLGSQLCFTVIFFWLLTIKRRVLALEAQRPASE